jgi:hypothetical protein
LGAPNTLPQCYLDGRREDDDTGFMRAANDNTTNEFSDEEPTVEIPHTMEDSYHEHTSTRMRLTNTIGPASVIFSDDRPRPNSGFDRAVQTCKCGAQRVLTLEADGEFWATDWAQNREVAT